MIKFKKIEGLGYLSSEVEAAMGKAWEQDQTRGLLKEQANFEGRWLASHKILVPCVQCGVFPKSFYSSSFIVYRCPACSAQNISDGSHTRIEAAVLKAWDAENRFKILYELANIPEEG